MQSYAAYRLLQRLAPRVPEAAAFALADALAATVAQRSSVWRTAVEANLRQLPPAADGSRPSPREVFRHFGRYLCEFFRMHRGTPRLVIEGRAHLEQCRAAGRGAILLTAHVGNWELGAVTIHRLGLPVSVVALSHPDPRTDALFVRQRERCGLRVLPLNQGISHRALRALSNGEFLGMLGDRDYMGNGEPVTFGSGCLTIPRGPAVLSLRSGAPILPAFLIREHERNAFSLWVEPPITTERGATHEAALRSLVRQCGRAIERYVRRFPEQWVVFDEAVRPSESPGPHRRSAHELERSILRSDSGC